MVTRRACLIMLTAGVFLLGAMPGSGVAAPRAPWVAGRVLVKFRGNVPTQRAAGVLAALQGRTRGVIPGAGVYVVQLPPGASEAAAAHALRAYGEVEFAEPDRVYAPEAVPNDPYYVLQWHLPRIECPAAWETTAGSAAVTVAILDTGVDGTHPDLVANMAAGWNVYDGNSNTADVTGHGTNVAGTVAATTNNGLLVAAVAGNCRIMPVRVSDPNGYAASSTIAAGLVWAADHGARVANISYAVTDSATVAAAAQYLQSLGGVTTVAAGNYGTFDSTPDNPYVLTVSATDSSDVRYSWSNLGTCVDLAAPGSVYTTARGGGAVGAVGTSFSAPIVAGVAALMLSVNPSLTGEEVQAILKESADDRGPAGWDPDYGWGRVNAARAVAFSRPDITPPAVSFSTPSQGAVLSKTVTVGAQASDDVAVARLSLYLDGELVAESTSSVCTFVWDTTTAANGVHLLTAVAADTAGNTGSAQVQVTVNNVSDTSAPQVAITAPSNGQYVGKTTLTVTVAASDNVGVTRVQLYLDGKRVGESTAAPFRFSLNTRPWSTGAHVLFCKAYDAAGNVGTSAAVTVYR
ncbi:MAG: S8 family serine peptidase [Armatimonadota bacterium]|nr:S8 family serine peptidase [Armatimonadota bacterium]